MKSRRARISGNDILSLVADPCEEDVIPRQMLQIIDCLDINDGVLTVDQLLFVLNERFKTKQGWEKVLRHYRARLEDEGFIVIEHCS